MSGSEHYGIRPDFITIAKGLTSAYAPLSGTIASDRVWQVLEQGTDTFGPIGHGWTYSAHPMCAAAGVANLKLIDELGLVENAADVGAALLAGLEERLGDHRHVGEIRGEGMLAAIELVEDRETRRFFDPSQTMAQKVVAALLAEGVIARAMPEADIIGFAPPLCLSMAQAERIVDATTKAVNTVLG